MQRRQTQSATDTRDASYAALRRSEDKLTAKQGEYLRLLKDVAKRGQATKAGPVLYDLTDKEAAALLGWERTSVNGRRNELCGGSGSSQQVKKQPLVEKAQKRRCLMTGSTVTAWRAVPSLFD